MKLGEIGMSLDSWIREGPWPCGRSMSRDALSVDGIGPRLVDCIPSLSGTGLKLARALLFIDP
jgi:hypothetical protein